MPINAAAGRFGLALHRAERGEVVLTEQCLSRAVHGLGIERARDPGAAQALERGACARVQDVVAIDPADRGVPRMEPRSDLGGPFERDGRWQPGVGAEHPRARGAPCRRVEVDDLADRVNAGIGPSRTGRLDGCTGNEGQGALDRILEGRCVSLRLPARVIRAVVLDQSRDAQSRDALLAQPGSDSIRRDASCFWLAEPSCTTSSRMLRAPSGSPMSM